MEDRPTRRRHREASRYTAAWTRNPPSRMPDTHPNADPAELRKFEAIASRWWDPTSEFRPLHEINPLRLDYVDQRAALQGRTRARRGLRRRHPRRRRWPPAGPKSPASTSGRPTSRWRGCTSWSPGWRSIIAEVAVEQLACERPAAFDVVTCMEMLEHVPDPASVIEACARLVKPGGPVFLSTLNRNPKSYLFAILGAEYVLGMLPKGHARLREVHPPVGARPLAARRRTRPRAHDGADLQPADASLRARPRRRLRELHGFRAPTGHA